MSTRRLSLLAALICAALLAPALVQRTRGAEERRGASIAEPVAERLLPQAALHGADLEPVPIEGAASAPGAALADALGPLRSQVAARTPVAPDPPRVEVLVVDALDRPLAGVPVAAFGPVERLMRTTGSRLASFESTELPRARASTGSDGVAVLMIEAGCWAVSLDREHAETVGYMQIVDVGPGGAARLCIRVGGLSLDLLHPELPTNAILGQVVDENGDPVRGAELSATPRSGAAHCSSSRHLFLVRGLEPRGECVLRATKMGYEPGELRARGGDGLVTLSMRRRPDVVLHLLGADGRPYQGAATVVPEVAGALPERPVLGPDAEVSYPSGGAYRLRVRADPRHLSGVFTAYRGHELAVQLEAAGTLALPAEPRPKRGAIVVRGEGRYERRVQAADLEEGIAVPAGMVDVEFPGGRRQTLRIAAGERRLLEP